MFNEMFSNSVKFDYDGKDNPYLTIEDYVLNTKQNRAQVKGMWINPKSKHGARGVIVLDGVNVNVPSHVNERIEKVRGNAEAVNAVNEGKCGVEFYTYEKDGKTYYSARFFDWA